MNILPFAASFPNFRRITNLEQFVEDARENYHTFKHKLFLNERTPGFFIYKIKTATRTHVGLIATLDINDYSDNRVKKHENTLLAKEQQQGKLLIERKAIVKPILLTHKHDSALSMSIEFLIEDREPMYVVDFPIDKQEHTVWYIYEPDELAMIESLYKTQIEKVYIADGHHRLEASKWLNQWYEKDRKLPQHDAFLCALFSSKELEIKAYNRIVTMGEDFDKTTFLSQLSAFSDIKLLEKPKNPTRKTDIGLYIQGQYYMMTWKKETLNKVDKKLTILDVALLNEHVFKNILDIKNIKTDQRVKYADGQQSLSNLIESCDKQPNSIGFALYPVDLKDLMAVADTDGIMPPKSTWFEPRMRNGLLVQNL